MKVVLFGYKKKYYPAGNRHRHRQLSRPANQKPRYSRLTYPSRIEHCGSSQPEKAASRRG